MTKIDIQKMRDFAWAWLIEGERAGELTPEESLFLYDAMVVFNQVQKAKLDIVVSDDNYERQLHLDRCKA